MIPFLRCLGACAAALLVAATDPASADPIGAVGDPSIISTIQGLSSIHEGVDGPEIWILFAATCEKSAAMRRTIAASQKKLQVSWVPAPIDGGQSDPATARLVGAGLNDMDKAFAGDLSGLPAAGGAAARQAQEIETGLARRMFQATGRPLATPTIVYRDPDGLIRVVRGAVGPDLFAKLAADAR
jgi:hypothetical protein